MDLMRAAVCRNKGKMEIDTLSIPLCPPGGVLIKIAYCGICGSDVRSYIHGLRYDIKNQILGHEISGEIVEISPGVKRFSKGDFVALAPDVSCGECWYCKRGLVNLCLSHKMIGTHYAGGFAQYIALSQEILDHGFIELIPDGLSLKHAAFAETCAAVLACQKNNDISFGNTVVIIGDGPVGCLHYEIAKARGARKVIILGRGKLEFAKKFKPDYIFSNYEPEKATKEVLAVTGSLGADIVIIAAPNVLAQQQAIHIVRKQGKIIIYGGVPKGNATSKLDSNLIHYNEITIIGSFSYNSTGLSDALSVLSANIINADNYITEIVTLDNIVLGIEHMRDGIAHKVLVDPWKQ